MAGNRWLYDKLVEAGRRVLPNHTPVLITWYRNKEFRVYSPNTREYVAGVEEVKKAIAAEATVFAYAKHTELSAEGEAYAQANGLTVYRYSELLKVLHC